MSARGFIEPDEGLTEQPHIFRDMAGRPMQFEEYEEAPGKSNPYTVSYKSYAGTDIAATVVIPGESPLHLGDMHTFSYSIHRENTPVRYLGHSNPCGWVKGPRTIAGSMVFTQFDQYTWYRLQRFRHLLNKGVYALGDMLPPFDMVLTFSNESGSFSKMKVFGMNIVDEGAAMSVDDLMIETDYTFMAQAILPITSYTPEGFETIKHWTAGSMEKTVPVQGNRLGVGFK